MLGSKRHRSSDFIETGEQLTFNSANSRIIWAKHRPLLFSTMHWELHHKPPAEAAERSLTDKAGWTESTDDTREFADCPTTRPAGFLHDLETTVGCLQILLAVRNGRVTTCLDEWICQLCCSQLKIHCSK